MALGASKSLMAQVSSSTFLLPRASLVTHDLAEASLHLHVGLAMFMDVGFAVLTAEPKFVIDLKGRTFE